jgi:hypothetical protein
MGEHPKCEALIATYGYEGYGRFLRLNELIGRADGCRLDLRRRVFFNQIAGKLRMKPDELREFLAFLADPDECGLVHNDGDILWTDRTHDDLERARATRRAGRERQKRLRNAEQDASNGEEPQSSTEVTRDEVTQHSTAQHSTEQAAAGAGFQPWLQEWARTNPRIRNAPAFVRKVLAEPGRYPDLLEQFEEEQPARASPPPSKPPPPERCDVCGSTTLRETTGVCECRDCGRHFEIEGDVWVADPETGKRPAPDVVEDFEDDCGLREAQ